MPCVANISNTNEWRITVAKNNDDFVIKILAENLIQFGFVKIFKKINNSHGNLKLPGIFLLL